MRPKNLPEILVRLVWQVGIEISFACECDEEAMREPIIKPLGTDIGAPFEIFNLEIHHVFQGSKSLLHFLDILFTGSFLKFEKDDVAIGRFFGG